MNAEIPDKPNNIAEIPHQSDLSPIPQTKDAWISAIRKVTVSPHTVENLLPFSNRTPQTVSQYLEGIQTAVRITADFFDEHYDELTALTPGFYEGDVSPYVHFGIIDLMLLRSLKGQQTLREYTVEVAALTHDTDVKNRLETENTNVRKLVRLHENLQHRFIQANVIDKAHIEELSGYAGYVLNDTTDRPETYRPAKILDLDNPVREINFE